MDEDAIEVIQNPEGPAPVLVALGTVNDEKADDDEPALDEPADGLVSGEAVFDAEGAELLPRLGPVLEVPADAVELKAVEVVAFVLANVVELEAVGVVVLAPGVRLEVADNGTGGLKGPGRGTAPDDDDDGDGEGDGADGDETAGVEDDMFGEETLEPVVEADEAGPGMLVLVDEDVLLGDADVLAVPKGEEAAVPEDEDPEDADSGLEEEVDGVGADDCSDVLEPEAVPADEVAGRSGGRA